MQLDALDGLRRIPPPEGPALSDLTESSFRMKCHDVWLRLNVEAAGNYELSTVDCFEPVELAVFAPDG